MREAFNEIVLCVALCGFVAVLLARAACSRAALRLAVATTDALHALGESTPLGFFA